MGDVAENMLLCFVALDSSCAAAQASAPNLLSERHAPAVPANRHVAHIGTVVSPDSGDTECRVIELRYVHRPPMLVVAELAPQFWRWVVFTSGRSRKNQERMSVGYLVRSSAIKSEPQGKQNERKQCPTVDDFAAVGRSCNRDMTEEIVASPEAIALTRIATAARDVQAASAALEKYFGAAGGAQPSTLELARFAASMQELRDAREEFDRLLSQSHQN
ncbi:hypothetical protein [Paraburkholderia sp. GAS348]|uniref:hypothetical protein n=1 Tax=Paraburkholderia sp. GAS348 TaxID=3035132 RepID=UPI003D22FCBE